MLRFWIVPIAAAALAACHSGPSVESFAPARGPYGIEVDLRVAREHILGELLEVQDSALLVRRGAQLLLVPLRVIKSGSFDTRGVLISGGRADPKVLEQLRLVSRFPAGLTPELRARLLAAYGQTEIERVGP
jgi:hypothetical protein